MVFLDKFYSFRLLQSDYCTNNLFLRPKYNIKHYCLTILSNCHALEYFKILYINVKIVTDLREIFRY